MKTKAMGIAAVMLLGLMGFTTAVGRQSSQGTTAAQSTPKPRRHHWNISTSSETIPQLLAKTTGDLIVRGFHISEPGGMPVNPPAYPPYYLTAMACESDAAVVGTTNTGVSHLTSDERFLYTDWAFTVEEVLKDNVKASIAPGSTITVAQPGGTMTIDGRTVRAIEENFRYFEKDGRYLLFLQYLPESNAYEASAENGFQLKADKVIRLTRNLLHPRLESKDPQTLILDTRAAVAAQIPQCVGGAEHP